LATSNEVHVSIAKRLLASATGGAVSGGDALDDAAAAGRVYETLARALAPVVGEAGVRALLARSLKLSVREFPCLAEIAIGGPQSEESTRIGPHIAGCLRKHDPPVAADAAANLYATFLALLARLVGEALTLQILRMAYPAIQAEETK
jgi:hypothetical protein